MPSMNLLYLDVKNWSQVGDRITMYGETLICVCMAISDSGDSEDDDDDGESSQACTCVIQ
jgi:hypothetical protein